MIRGNDTPPVFTPGNEPYLGLEPVLHFDHIICWSLESNERVAKWTRKKSDSLSPLQRAACQIIPQSISIALSIRELIRQGYLFSALILMRPLIERAATVSYLDDHPEAVSLWEGGWQYHKRPKLATMMASMAGGVPDNEVQNIVKSHNSMVHGDPISSYQNLVALQDGEIGYASGKILNNPDLCGSIAMECYLYLIVITARMSKIFPEVRLDRPTGH
ncbi:MAG: hypothetical protein QME75_14995 [Deltaproteobacteria bacterium]|nr:hypothetical protein [Deltaproteobacteria bacterium]